MVVTSAEGGTTVATTVGSWACENICCENIWLSSTDSWEACEKEDAFIIVIKEDSLRMHSLQACSGVLWGGWAENFILNLRVSP